MTDLHVLGFSAWIDVGDMACNLLRLRKAVTADPRCPSKIRAYENALYDVQKLTRHKSLSYAMDCYAWCRYWQEEGSCDDLSDWDMVAEDLMTIIGVMIYG